MIIAHVLSNEREADYECRKFLYDNSERVITFSKHEKKIFLDGEEHYFMGLHSYYNNWCKGRTYMLHGELYHSGYKTKG